MEPVDFSEPPNPSPPAPPRKEKGLYHRTVMGGFWIVALQGTTKFLAAVNLFVLANILGSANWGMLGIASLVISTLTVFTQTGFQHALIQKKDDIRSYLNTAWSVELARGWILFLCIFFAAPWAIQFFDREGWFKPGHLRNPAALLKTFREGKDPLSAFVYERLSDETRIQDEQIQAGVAPTETLIASLSEDLNRILPQQGVSDSDRLLGVHLSRYTRKLLESTPFDRIRAHRRILQDAYPKWVEETVIDRDTAVWVTRILALSLVLGALINIGTVGFIKELQFHRHFLFSILSTLAETITTLILAFLTRSVWSLVWGRMLGVTLKVIISYGVHPYRPRFQIHWGRALELWKFGQWIFMSNILGYTQVKGDQLVVGKMLGPVMLGVYGLASKISHTPATGVTSTLSEVFFPAYAKLQHDPDRLRNAFLKALQLTSFLAFPFAGLIFVLSPDFVHVFFTDDWLPMIPVIQILSFKGLMQSVQASFGILYRSVGKPKITAYMQTARLILMVILIVPMTLRWGILGVAGCMVLVSVIMQPVGYFVAMRILRCRPGAMVHPVVYPLAASVGMAVVAYGLRRNWYVGEFSFWTLTIFGGIGVGLYAMAIGILDLTGMYRIRPILKEIFEVFLQRIGGRVIREPAEDYTGQ